MKKAVTHSIDYFADDGTPFSSLPELYAYEAGQHFPHLLHLDLDGLKALLTQDGPEANKARDQLFLLAQQARAGAVKRGTYVPKRQRESDVEGQPVGGEEAPGAPDDAEVVEIEQTGRRRRHG